MTFWNSFVPYLQCFCIVLICCICLIQINGWKPDFHLDRYYASFLVCCAEAILLRWIFYFITSSWILWIASYILITGCSRILSAGTVQNRLMAILVAFFWILSIYKIVEAFWPYSWLTLLLLSGLTALLIPLFHKLSALFYFQQILLIALYLCGTIILLFLPSGWFLPLTLLILAVSLTASITLYSRLRATQKSADTLQELNLTLESNYAAIASQVETLYAERHDFRNQLRVLENLDTNEIHQHIVALSGGSSSGVRHCHSRDRYINAVINCKLDLALEMEIPINYSVTLSKPLPIPSTEIIALLGNQLDNAIEACYKITDPSKRMIHISIEENMDFIGFIVKNTIVPGSLESDSALVTTKTDTTMPHGLGIKNIRRITDKYNGSLQNIIKDDMFISTVLIQID